MKLHTIGEAAEILRITVPTLRRIVKRREIHFRRIANRLMFAEVDLAEFVDANRDTPWRGQA